MKLKNKQSILFPSLLALLAAVLAVRAFYGFCWSDESFYLTFADRLWKGQQLVVDEWHPVQFYAAMVYPALTVYRFFFGTTGIYLFLRLLYVALAFGLSLYLYQTLRRRFPPGASFLCACLYLTYSRGNIWGCSYYNLFLSLVVLALCLTLRGLEASGRKRGALFALCGVSLAGSVLCVPYFAPFVIVTLLALLFTRRRKDALWAAAGIAGAAAAFVICFLPKDLGAVLENLRYILSDPEHTTGPAANLLANLKDVVFLYYREALLALAATVLVLVCEFFLPSAPVRLGCLVFLSLGAAVSFYRYRGAETGFANYTLVLFCLPLLALSWARRRVSIPALLIRLLGLAMMIAFGLSSNTEAIAFTIGLVVYAMGAVLQLEYLTQGSRCYRLWATGLVCVSLALTLNSRMTGVFRDGPLDTLDTPMTGGPAAGIRTTAEHAEQYQSLLSMLQELNDTYSPENHIFLSKLMPWGYPASDFLCGAPTAWRTPLSSPRLESYYTLHPQSVPEIVVVLADTVGEYPGDSTPNENALEGWLWDYMTEHRYEKIDYALAEVYVSPGAVKKEK